MTINNYNDYDMINGAPYLKLKDFEIKWADGYKKQIIYTDKNGIKWSGYTNDRELTNRIKAAQRDEDRVNEGDLEELYRVARLEPVQMVVERWIEKELKDAIWTPKPS